MKVIIGYDGSNCARAAIADLARAGLPEHTHAIVVTARQPLSEAQLALCAPVMGAVAGEDSSENLSTLARDWQKEAGRMAQEGMARVRQRCPGWTVDWGTAEEAPGRAIVAAACEHQADLIIVGSRGWSALRRFLAGSVSQEVMRSAPCSVRGVHEHAEHATGPLRLIVAFSPADPWQPLVNAVAERQWPAATTVCLLTVTTRHPVVATGPGAESAAGTLEPGAAALEMVGAAGYRTEHVERHGDPVRLILEEAREWGADCIFISPHAFGSPGRAGVGAVARSVFAAASCSVEVVRGPT